VRAAEAPHGHSEVPSTVTIATTGGQEFTRRVEAFKGAPARALERAEMREKFLMLTRGEPAAETMFERFDRLEEEAGLDWLGA
jgi:2-methylcitrate dehydratase PrpD